MHGFADSEAGSVDVIHQDDVLFFNRFREADSETAADVAFAGGEFKFRLRASVASSDKDRFERQVEAASENGGKKFGLIETAGAAAGGGERNGNNNMIFPGEADAGGVGRKTITQKFSGGKKATEFKRVNEGAHSRRAVA